MTDSGIGSTSWGMTHAAQDESLLQLGRWLQDAGYRFFTPTPATHARVNARATPAQASSLTDVFGWSRLFARGALPSTAWELLQASGALREVGSFFQSEVRFSTLGKSLYVHSAYPTDAADSVFFGPDTYRFARMLDALPGTFSRAVDVGTGTGAGLLSLAERCGECILADVNPRALRMSRVNTKLNGHTATSCHSDLLSGVTGAFDLIVSNPPYLVDAEERTYRHGGKRGIELALRLVEAAIPRLGMGGTLALYTGSPIVAGVDLFEEAVRPQLEDTSLSWRYQTLDVDVFGEELATEACSDVDRIAVVSLVAVRHASS